MRPRMPSYAAMTAWPPSKGSTGSRLMSASARLTRASRARKLHSPLSAAPVPTCTMPTIEIGRTDSDTGAASADGAQHVRLGGLGGCRRGARRELADVLGRAARREQPAEAREHAGRDGGEL